ncbi:MAG: hypothetical protein JXR91_05930, partial [Deltaproteobacteria bacterium]|nr:hypothetical protein [Deltaproteobacteria bacterium]
KGWHSKNFPSLDTEAKMYGNNLVQPLDDKNGAAISVKIYWKIGALLRIEQELRGTNGILLRTYQYCNGILCFAEQRETVQKDMNGFLRSTDDPVRVYQIYLNKKETLKTVSYDEISTQLIYSTENQKSIHSIEPLKTVFSNLTKDGERLYKNISNNLVPTVDEQTRFIDSSEEAVALKDNSPYVTVDLIHGSRLIIGRAEDFINTDEMLLLNGTIDNKMGEAVISYDEIKRGNLITSDNPLSFIIGKPFIIYNENDHSKLVHVKELFIAARFLYGSPDLSASEVFQSATPYIGAIIEETLDYKENWQWGHYAGFATPEAISGNWNDFEKLDMDFDETHNIKEWGEENEIYNDVFIGENKRYRYYFRFSSKGDICDQTGEDIYNDAWGMLIYDLNMDSLDDYSNFFDGISGIAKIPYDAYEDTELQGTIFLFKGRYTDEIHLVLFQHGELKPLINIPDQVNDFGPC